LLSYLYYNILKGDSQYIFVVVKIIQINLKMLKKTIDKLQKVCYYVVELKRKTWNKEYLLESKFKFNKEAETYETSD